MQRNHMESGEQERERERETGRRRLKWTCHELQAPCLPAIRDTYHLFLPAACSA